LTNKTNFLMFTLNEKLNYTQYKADNGNEISIRRNTTQHE